jgi:hypothetical protein
MPTPIFSVSGRDGSAGATGYGYGGSMAQVGQHGTSGSDGRAGEFGIPAGTITLQISSLEAAALLPHNVVLAQPLDADVMIEGELVYPSGEAQRIDTILKVDSGEQIHLRAKGGDGGRGGDGGNGQNGGAGVPYVFLISAWLPLLLNPCGEQIADKMQLNSHTAPTVVLVEMEEMGEMPVVAVMVHLAEQYD